MPEHLQRHHVWHPRKAYKTKMEKRFRNLGCSIEMLTPEAHRERHRAEPNGTPGGKPNREFMIRAIRKHENGECKCHQPPSP